jgi:hypothetical protein
MPELIDADLRFVAQRLPRDIRDLLTANAGKLFVGGGFVRATIAGETPSDIDLFGDNKERLAVIAKDLVASRPGSKMHTTKNAITVITPDRLSVQFITRWTFDNAEACVASFDFTVCQGVIWRGGNQSNSPWRSATGERFYIDLAARRLVYTSPVREEEAGGSMLRVLKYVKRGYSIQVTSLGAVIARMSDKVDFARATATAENPNARITTALVLAGMLREVDPLLVVDGFDVVDDHEPLEGHDNG